MKRLLLLLALASLGFAAAFAAPRLVASAAIVRVPTAPLGPVEQAMNFLLSAPAAEAQTQPVDLWATYYDMPTVRPAAATDASAKPLLDRRGRAISAPLSREDWCNVAMQGSAWVKNPDGSQTAYVYIDSGGPDQMDCGAHFGDLSPAIKYATRHARFAAFHHPQGCDVRPIPLMAYRNIAVDADRIPMGTVLFVPGLQGRSFWMNGEFYVHDGYVIASDKGGAIKGNHIDLFVDDGAAMPFRDVVSSNRRDTFQAYVVPRDAPAAQALMATRSEICRDVRGPGRRGVRTASAQANPT
jgi:3D (Asp-Asp-Asp) domain-containing protein